MKNSHLRRLLVLFILANLFLLSADIVSAEDLGQYEIRGMSSRKNGQLFDKITIDLLNGKSRFISLDNMVDILREFKVVEFHSADIEPAESIILKEVAFRMLKSHYLPRPGDKIKVYKLQDGLSSPNGARSQSASSLEASIILPIEASEIKDNNELAAIHWSNMSSQISTAIEKLWLRRVGQVSFQCSRENEKILLDATVLLRRKFIQDENIDEILERYPAIRDVVSAAAEKLEHWLEEGAILREDAPVLAEMAIQYIILSNTENVSEIIRDLNGFKDLDDLLEALLYRIKFASEKIKNYDPSDYGAFAMLQSLLNEISYYSPGKTAAVADRPISIDFPSTQNSA
ncbi:MAG: hypothetical protein ABH843_03555 [Candidatus Omnitrophota bacterium]